LAEESKFHKWDDLKAAAKGPTDHYGRPLVPVKTNPGVFTGNGIGLATIGKVTERIIEQTNRATESSELMDLPGVRAAGDSPAVGAGQPRAADVRGLLHAGTAAAGVERGPHPLDGYAFPIRRLTTLGHLNCCKLDDAPKPAPAPWMPLTAKPLLMLPAPKIAGLLPEGPKVVAREPEQWERTILKLVTPLEITDLDEMPGVIPAPVYAKSDIELAYERRVQVVREMKERMKAA
jgi:hypothetical protein